MHKLYVCATSQLYSAIKVNICMIYVILYVLEQNAGWLELHMCNLLLLFKMVLAVAIVYHNSPPPNLNPMPMILDTTKNMKYTLTLIDHHIRHSFYTSMPLLLFHLMYLT